MATALKGAPVAAALLEKYQPIAQSLPNVPTLATVRAGSNPDDVAYENALKKRCAAMGVELRIHELALDADPAEALALVQALNADTSVHGVLLFRPMPKAYDELLRTALDPDKDVDGVTDGSLARLFKGAEGFAPCTAAACVEMLDHYGIDPAGKNIAIAGRSLVVGKPAAMLLCGRNATVTICHSKTADLPAVTRGADIVIAAIGKARFFGAEYFSENQVVLDVGINMMEGKLCGDVDFAAAEPIVSAITPVPGGIGAVTTALLVSNVIRAAAKAQGVEIK